jgi:hypothetical protein
MRLMTMTGSGRIAWAGSTNADPLSSANELP